MTAPISLIESRNELADRTHMSISSKKVIKKGIKKASPVSAEVDNNGESRFQFRFCNGMN
jgi:hypothetical protein